MPKKLKQSNELKASNELKELKELKKTKSINLIHPGYKKALTRVLENYIELYPNHIKTDHITVLWKLLNRDCYTDNEALSARMEEFILTLRPGFWWFNEDNRSKSYLKKQLKMVQQKYRIYILLSYEKTLLLQYNQQLRQVCQKNYYDEFKAQEQLAHQLTLTYQIAQSELREQTSTLQEIRAINQQLIERNRVLEEQCERYETLFREQKQKTEENALQIAELTRLLWIIRREEISGSLNTQAFDAEFERKRLKQLTHSECFSSKPRSTFSSQIS